MHYGERLLLSTHVLKRRFGRKKKTAVPGFKSPGSGLIFFIAFYNGGERGIRTPGTVAGTLVFKTSALNRSAISPRSGAI